MNKIEREVENRGGVNIKGDEFIKSEGGETEEFNRGG